MATHGQRTRLGQHGGPRLPWGVFAGKALTIDVAFIIQPSFNVFPDQDNQVRFTHKSNTSDTLPQSDLVQGYRVGWLDNVVRFFHKTQN